MTFPFPSIEEPPHGHYEVGPDGKAVHVFMRGDEAVSAIRELQTKVERLQEQMSRLEGIVLELHAAVHD